MILNNQNFLSSIFQQKNLFKLKYFGSQEISTYWNIFIVCNPIIGLFLLFTKL